VNDGNEEIREVMTKKIFPLILLFKTLFPKFYLAFSALNDFHMESKTWRKSPYVNKQNGGRHPGVYWWRMWLPLKREVEVITNFGHANGESLTTRLDPWPIFFQK